MQEIKVGIFSPQLSCFSFGVKEKKKRESKTIQKFEIKKAFGFGSLTVYGISDALKRLW